ncbi:MAG: NTP transferase domain-containing protein [Oscillospiraceae bacterium]|nr:NTP transferase domain-containing protein [Oscillospiraceae bacterium]
MTLLILAAGLGTRFHGGIKQLAQIGKNGETLMELSAIDAAKAGFDRAVFVIRRDIEDKFKAMVGDRIGEHLHTEYCFQDINDIPDGFDAGDRTKPWGTVHAVLAAKELINDPFVIINADDFYGETAYKDLYAFFSGERSAKEQCMAGFKLCNTISRNGTVTRGICESEEGMLSAVHETYHVGLENGIITGDGENGRIALDGEKLVSMNMWGFDPSIMGLFEDRFRAFIERVSADGSIASSEYPLPIAVDELIRSGDISVKVIPTHDKWYGMTLSEDVEEVRCALADR